MFFHSPIFDGKALNFYSCEFLVWIFLTQIDKGYWSNKLCNQVLALTLHPFPATFTLLSSEDKLSSTPEQEETYLYLYFCRHKPIIKTYPIRFHRQNCI